MVIPLVVLAAAACSSTKSTEAAPVEDATSTTSAITATTAALPAPTQTTVRPPSVAGVWRQRPSQIGDQLSPGVVWTGTELLAIRGQAPGEVVVVERFDPARGEAKAAAPSGLDMRADPAIVWTGTELLVIGGASQRRSTPTSAAYSPATDRWRALAEPPISIDDVAFAGTNGQNVVWTGKEAILWSVGLAFNPATNRWRTLPRLPEPPMTAVAVWSGSRVVVWGGCPRSISQCDDNREGLLTTGASLDPNGGEWTPLPPSPLSAGAHPSGQWTDAGLVIYAGARHDPRPDSAMAAVLSPGLDRWTVLPAPPLSADRRYTASATDGRRFVLWGGSYFVDFGDGALLDMQTKTWSALPLAPKGVERDRHRITLVGNTLYVDGGWKTHPWFLTLSP